VRNEIDEFICLNTRPIFLGQDLTGQFISQKDFVVLLGLLNKQTEELLNKQAKI